MKEHEKSNYSKQFRKSEFSSNSLINSYKDKKKSFYPKHSTYSKNLSEQRNKKINELDQKLQTISESIRNFYTQLINYFDFDYSVIKKLNN